ncbi:hypothetical protein [Inquilinus limosus]|uniref:hypothetical protein n=1 Tax=Inquilinus limosus TaxID=171674 RepID=UPI0011982A8A|nr:hypothetical protein [Inquilinus limosus]
MLIARARRRAVVFRRGPTRLVRLLAWNLAKDTIDPGQWFKGRIYERRCDLSPDGELLAYFAATHRPPYYSWTAISRPPWLTALVLWPKGDSWGGGGLFESPLWFKLNHRTTTATASASREEKALTTASRILLGPGQPERTDETAVADGFAVPKRMRVEPLGDRPGWGEDDPICWMRLKRDGWHLVGDPANARYHGSKGLFGWDFPVPLVIEKNLGAKKSALRLSTHAVFERQGRKYVQTAALLNAEGGSIDLGRVDWADLDHNGDVLYAAEGCLYRLDPAQAFRGGTGLAAARLVADLNDMAFEPIKAPDNATHWRR